MKLGSIAAAIALALGTISPASAEVTDRAVDGFTVKFVVDIAAAPESVYSALVDHVAEWWSAEHTFSGAAKNLSIAAKPGGCFCEALPNGGGVEHGVVVQARPGALLRVRGALGPLQGSGVAAVMTWELEKAGQGTKLTLTQSAGGYFPGGLDKLAVPVDAVLGDSVKRLKAYVEAKR